MAQFSKEYAPTLNEPVYKAIHEIRMDVAYWDDIWMLTNMQEYLRGRARNRHANIEWLLQYRGGRNAALFTKEWNPGERPHGGSCALIARVTVDG